MDSLITAAARALATGDPLGALKRVALRNDAPALALRGIALAQLGDLRRARELLRRAGRAFGPREAVARARCVVAEAEIALASRELSCSARVLETARATLEARGDVVNGTHARYLAVRRALLLGRLEEADSALAALDPGALPPAFTAVHALLNAGIALRRLRGRQARAALATAAVAAQAAAIPALLAEVEAVARVLSAPAARRIVQGAERMLQLEEVEALFAADVLIVDGCRLLVCNARARVSLARRPVLFTLARALAEAWPADIPRGELISRAFRARTTDESYRVRLRVELGRLRRALKSLAEVRSTARGFVLLPRGGREVVVLAPPVEAEHAGVLALLADGESWSSSALALALGASQRTVQRSLEWLCSAGRVQFLGRGRTRRWISVPTPGITTTLLLPAAVTAD